LEYNCILSSLKLSKNLFSNFNEDHEYFLAACLLMKNKASAKRITIKKEFWLSFKKHFMHN